jgi:hypothetical protein
MNVKPVMKSRILVLLILTVCCFGQLLAYAQTHHS